MGSWEQVITVEQREKYNELLKKSDKAYEHANLKGLNRLLGERQGVAFVYTENESASFQIPLLLAPMKENPKMLKIVNSAPIGDFDPATALKIIWSKIREIIDSRGLEGAYGTPMKHYDNPKLTEYYGLVPEIMWELISKGESSNEKYSYTFIRTADRKNEDSLFKGPGSTVQ